MRLETRLKQEAKESCEFRGHKMMPFVTLCRPNPLMGVRGYVARSLCAHCGKYVQIETRPAPNSIDIGGDALALNC